MASPFINQAAFSQQARSAATAAEKLAEYNAEQLEAARNTHNFSTAIGNSKISLDNFDMTLDNAIRKVIIWQFAIAAVYGVIRKVGEAVKVFKDFEVTLARIGITTDAVGSKLDEYFKQVANVAIQFGMPIEQTLQGMDLALRATASLGRGAERTSVAVTLLKDASVLANITGMQYSQSIDILVGSLRQSGLALDQGITLLDKWVAVAKNAAVSVNDLSQGFAIMADAGKAAGLTVDQINGLIAALSETVTLGPVEIGNSIRALMATLYNPGSIALLQKYGVAVRDTSGEVRSFWEVMQQLSAMKMANILDDSSWLEIAKAAGAGQRQYAKFLALLNNMSTATRVVSISQTAEGQAMAANQRIVDTLTNSYDKFTAAQRKFMYIGGENTGVISDMTNALLTLTKVFDRLSNASEGVWKLGRAITFLVGTLTALKIASIFWLHATPNIAAGLGSLGGVLPYQVSGSAAALQAMKIKHITTAEAALAAGIGVTSAGRAASLGGHALAGLLPLQLQQLVYRNSGLNYNASTKQWMIPAPPGTTYNAAANKWMGYNEKGKYGFVPAPPVGGRPYQQVTWGGVRNALNTPIRGAGAAVAALGAGTAIYGLTGEKWTAAGAAVGAGIGSWFGGPLGIAVGTLFGSVIGQAFADSLKSSEDRLKAMVTAISSEMGSNPEQILKLAPQNDDTEAAARLRSKLAAPTMPEIQIAKQRPFMEKLYGQAAAFAGPFVGWGGRGILGKEDWTEGLGALEALNRALADGVITTEEYTRAKKEDRIAWEELSDAAREYMVYARIVSNPFGLNAPPDVVETAKSGMDVSKQQVISQRALAHITNEYAQSQKRIKEIMEESGAAVDGMTLKQWEQVHVQELLQSQLKMLPDEYDAMNKVIFGSGAGYAAYLESLERLNLTLKESAKEIPADTWLLIQQSDTALATSLAASATTLSDYNKQIETFKVNFAEIAAVAGFNSDATIDDIDKIQEKLKSLSESTGDKKYMEALQSITDYFDAIISRQSEAGRWAALNQYASEYREPTGVRLTDSDTINAYRKAIAEQGEGLPAFTKLAESLGKPGTTILTLVDALTGDTLRLDENSLALDMLSQAVQDNTKVQKEIEAQYNVPSSYATPSRYWYYHNTGSTEFGPAQTNLWAEWQSFIKERGMATGGDITETGAYYLHKGETVTNSDMLNGTNNILVGTHRVLVTSQNYLSQISIGVVALRNEIASLRSRLDRLNTPTQNDVFSRVIESGMGGDIPKFGARGLLS